MKHYTIDEFIPTTQEGELTLEDLKDIVDKKVSLLYDFCILGRRDKRKVAIISLLGQCKNEAEMTQMLYDVLHGKETLDQLLQRKGVLK